MFLYICVCLWCLVNQHINVSLDLCVSIWCLCVLVYLCTWMSLCESICLSVPIFLYGIYVSIYLCMSIHLCSCLSVCLCMSIYLFPCVCMSVLLCVYVSPCFCVSVCLCVWLISFVTVVSWEFDKSMHFMFLCFMFFYVLTSICPHLLILAHIYSDNTRRLWAVWDQDPKEIL